MQRSQITALSAALAMSLMAGSAAAQTADLRVLPPAFDYAAICRPSSALETDPIGLAGWNGGAIDAPTDQLMRVAALYRRGSAEVEENPALARRLYAHISETRGGRDAVQARFQIARLILDAEDASPEEQSTAVEYLRQAAAQGVGSAAVELAKLYEEGRGVAKDFSAAAQFYRIAAVAAQPDAAFALARLYNDGLVAAPDPDAGRQMANLGLIELLNQASQGKCGALLSIARIYDRGGAVKQDQEVASAWYLAASQAGDDRAMIETAERFAGGVGVDLDMDAAVRWYGIAAETGRHEAAFAIGRLYSEGDVLAPDAAKAQQWLERAATDGSIKAMQRLGEFWAGELPVQPETGPDGRKALGWLETAYARDPQRLGVLHALAETYRDGGDVPADPVLSVRYFNEAAAQGSVTALRALAEAYLAGAGVEADATEAVRLYRQAAGRGDTSSFGKLEGLYRCGIGVEQDIDEADLWLDRAASLGAPTAMLAQAEIYRADGSDDALAERRFVLLRAAAGGHRPAMVALAETYAAGIGVAPDPDSVERWTRLALADGLEEDVIDGLLAMAAAVRGEGPLSGPVGDAVPYLERAAELGSDTAQLDLGRLLLEGGPGVRADQARALALMEAASTAGHSAAPRALARLALNTGDWETALAQFDAAIAGGDRLARLEKAKLLYNGGMADETSLKAARAELDAAVAAGPCAKSETIAIADAYAKGIGGEPAKGEAFRWIEFTRAAFPVDDDDVVRIARIAMDAAQDPAQTEMAIALMTEAAERGSARAMYQLYRVHRDGAIPGVTADAAAGWLAQAAEIGHPEALYERALGLAAGQTGAPDFVAATTDLDAAAVKGHTPSMRMLAKWRLSGLVGVSDQDGAISLLRRAADQGDPKAMLDLANLLVVGIGATPDPKVAFDWIQRAAEQGSGEAMHRLAVAYATGFGVKADADRAAFWTEAAIDSGYLSPQARVQ